jgi:hypothetical protein
MSKLIVKVSDFNVNNVSMGPVKVMESGGKMCSLNYSYGASSGPLTTQVGPLSLPYGMNVFDKAGPIKYSMDLSLRGYEENPKVKAVYDAFTALDEHMIDLGVKNSKQWFKADLSRDVVKAFYTPMVKIAKDADGNPKPYPPTIKINLRKDRNQNDAWEVKLFEMVDGEPREVEGVPLEDLLVKGAQLTTLIQCTSVWFAGSKYGLSWKAKQIRMDTVPESIRGYAFVDEEESVQKPTSRPVATQNKFAKLQEEDDAEADEDEAFSAPAPAPAPTPSVPTAKKQSVLTAMLPPAPAPAPADDVDDDAEDHEPIPVPKKTITKKTIVKAVAKKA